MKKQEECKQRTPPISHKNPKTTYMYKKGTKGNRGKKELDTKKEK